MATFVQGYQLRTLMLGTQVLKPAQTPPNSGTSATLFTVTGGVVLVSLLMGRVSTALSGTTGAIALGSKPTTGTEVNNSIATATVVGGAEIGTLLVPIDTTTTGLGGALVNTALKAGTAAFLSAAFFAVNTGTIEITTSVATMTGAIDWYLTYVPLDTGASVS